MQVSIVVPTFQRPELLERCLRALANQAFDKKEYEVIVADDAASSETQRQVLAFATECQNQVLYVPVQRRHGPAAARNAGWQKARSPIIAFTDDDCIPDPGWLKAAVKAFQQNPDAAAVIGQIRVPLSQKPTDYERDTAGLETAEFVTANCFCRQDVLAELGGFDERFSAAWREDSDLHFRLLKRGGKLLRVPEAVVIHPVRTARWGACLSQQRKGLFDALLYKKHPKLYWQRIRPGTPWHYYVILAALAWCVIAALTGHLESALVAMSLWVLLTAGFCAWRLRHTSRTPAHVAEIITTSILIPPLSTYWRLYGAVRFRVLFL